MITILGSLLGFFSSFAPDIIKYFSDKRDHDHELRMIEMQLAAQAQGHSHRLEEIDARADIAESRALYKTYNTGVTWVDALNGTVRPVLAYSFFGLYAAIKIMQIHIMDWSTPLPWLLAGLWTPEDQAIFAGIISFYFGQRAMRKVRERS